MTLIVADTGPINYLIQIGCVDVLPKLVTAVVLPVSVVHELQSVGAPEAVREWVDNLPEWIEVRKPSTMIPAKPELSEADRAAVSMAKELHALLLMDDRRARRAADNRHSGHSGSGGGQGADLTPAGARKIAGNKHVSFRRTGRPSAPSPRGKTIGGMRSDIVNFPPDTPLKIAVISQDFPVDTPKPAP